MTNPEPEPTPISESVPTDTETSPVFDQQYEIDTGHPMPDIPDIIIDGLESGTVR